MRFGFTEEQEMIREMAVRFVEREVARNAGSLDEEEKFNRPLFDRMAELGFTGLPWPESDGGSGGGFLSFIMTLEEIARVSASIGVVLWAHVYLSMWPIYRFGHEELKQLYIRKMIEGQLLGAGVLPQLMGERRSTLHKGVIAKVEGNRYVLEGLEKYVVGADNADVNVIYAEMFSDNSRKPKRYSAFLVEKGTPGLHILPVRRKLGLRSTGMAHLKFEHCLIGKEQRIGDEGQGEEIARQTSSSVRYGLAAIAAGIARGAADLALAYAKVRTQFGKPIGKHQSIAFSLADMDTAADASILLAYQSAWREDQGLEDSNRSMMALSYASDAAVNSAISAVQIFGAYGYTKDFPVERFLRDAKTIQLIKGLDKARR
ncbi:butyryl-CoA dehydrogenase [Paenibacillus baekrokdamisoli]|uniref:Butyryl-CoA dehydrogenase n=1 Tax=Paenibacillus baekrokdamisoli TaxID=1712516 RepID=A0A3G9IUX7_9BACL|nr:acyl-CoA dehydrogenase family protein [Paenibacillus baekrokdamisoli]MBB3070826.1 alkylation response protein AidB-like acyl-CoA dehydrogenase [Paenibacillus baekrokdamisoli]BBH22236.1 butyryl-CoA dehydrogenase [Paenibacillus baekrokdamisoli]